MISAPKTITNYINRSKSVVFAKLDFRYAKLTHFLFSQLWNEIVSYEISVQRGQVSSDFVG